MVSKKTTPLNFDFTLHPLHRARILPLIINDDFSATLVFAHWFLTEFI